MEENKQFPLPQEDPELNSVLPEEAVSQGMPIITPLDMQPLPEESDAAEEITAAIADETDPEEVVPEETFTAEPVTEEPAAEDAEEPVAEESAAEDAAVPAEETCLSEDSIVTKGADFPEEPVEPEDAMDPQAETSVDVPEEIQPISPEFPVADSAEEPASAEEIPARTGEEFMARIPDVDDDYPEPDPETAKTIQDIEALLDKPVDQDYQEIEPDPVFDAMLATPVSQEEEKKEYERPTRKGRPKRRKGEGLFGIPNILATVVWLALIVMIGVTAGRMLWVCAADVLAFGREDKPVTVTIYESDTMEDIVDKLHSNGLIRYKSLFNLYASISDAEEDIKPGIYDLNTRYDYHALVNFMSPRSSREVIKLTIPEGYTCRQIFALLEENRICTAKDAAAYAANGELSE